LQVGEQYLMYTADNGTGYLPWRGCTRSRSAKEADEDLKFLNGLDKAPPTGTVFGQVVVSRGRIYDRGEPASGATVEIQGEGERLSSKTDSTGHYSFSGLKPGSYVVSASQRGFHESATESDDGAEVEARACAVADLVLREDSNGTIGGRVIRSDGTPAPAGITLDLIRTKSKEQHQNGDLLIGFSVQTDDHGEYSFHGVAPGQFKIVLNIYKVPTPRNPFPTMYWPAASTEGAASAVEISKAITSQRCDFHLPAALNSTPVKVIVLLPDGTPARGVRTNIGTRRDGVFAWAGEAITDASGQFSFGAMEGFEYTVQDIMTGEAKMAFPVHFSASDGSQPVIVKLVPRDR
jgi:hypothetical protein